MIIIIDAYNLLHALRAYPKKLSEHERNRFIATIGRYGSLRKHKMILVFDGGPFEWPYKEQMFGVYVVYSGTRQTADDYIKEYVDEHKAKDLLLVSSDAELRKYAARFNINSLKSSEFCLILQESMPQKEAHDKHSVDLLVKTTHDKQPDIDALMMQASKIVPQKSDDIKRVVPISGPNNQLSKDERKLLKKLKKL